MPGGGRFTESPLPNIALARAGRLATERQVMMRVGEPRLAPTGFVLGRGRRGRVGFTTENTEFGYRAQGSAERSGFGGEPPARPYAREARLSGRFTESPQRFLWDGVGA